VRLRRDGEGGINRTSENELQLHSLLVIEMAEVLWKVRLSRYQVFSDAHQENEVPRGSIRETAGEFSHCVQLACQNENSSPG